MLKKAGIVVLGAAAGMISLAPLASAGEAPQHNDDHGHSQDWHHGDRDRGGCDKFAGSAGDRLISLDNVASNADLTHVNVLGTDNSHDDGCHGGGRDGGGRHGGGRDGGGHGRGGDSTAVSAGNRLISADNLLANANVSHVNVLGTDNSR